MISVVIAATDEHGRCDARLPRRAAENPGELYEAAGKLDGAGLFRRIWQSRCAGPGDPLDAATAADRRHKQMFIEAFIS